MELNAVWESNTNKILMKKSPLSLLSHDWIGSNELKLLFTPVLSRQNIPSTSLFQCATFFFRNLFCDYYNSQQKIYCKRLRVLCPEHTKEPKVKILAIIGWHLTSTDTWTQVFFFRSFVLVQRVWYRIRSSSIDMFLSNSLEEIPQNFEYQITGTGFLRIVNL